MKKILLASLMMFSNLTLKTEQIRQNDKINNKIVLFSIFEPKIKHKKYTENKVKLNTKKDVLSYIKTLEDFVEMPTNGYIGHGHKIKKSDNFKRICKKTADSLLNSDFNYALSILNRDLEKHKKRLRNNQKNSIGLFIFNLGEGNYYNSSLRKYVMNNKHYNKDSIFNYFTLFSYFNGRENTVIYNRRAIEAALFNTK